MRSKWMVSERLGGLSHLYTNTAVGRVAGVEEPHSNNLEEVQV